MTVHGVHAVEQADRVLRVAEGDIVTPLARERASDLGIEIVVGGGPSPVDGRRGSGATRPGPSLVEQAPPTPRYPPSNALLRRGAPLPTDLLPSRDARRDTRLGGNRHGSRAVVVGAGHVGQITALRLCDADLFGEVVLVDVLDGLAAGIALDLTHSAALGHFRTRVRGVTTVEEAGRADYVVITAGRPRQPGMSRADLITTNAEIVGSVASDVARVSPDAVILVVSNPLDEMTQYAQTTSGFPPSRVIGMAGVLDTARFQALAGLTGVAAADEVTAYALGSHGDEMVIPLSQASAHGWPLRDQLDADVIDGLVDRTRGSGAEVVGLLKAGSAFMAPGMSAAHMVVAMRTHTGEVLPASVMAQGEYGIHGVYIGLPARLGPHGVEDIVELGLTPEEVRGLRDAAARIRSRLGSLGKAS